METSKPFQNKSWVQEADSLLRIVFSLSKWPHLHRKYQVIICKRRAKVVLSCITNGKVVMRNNAICQLNVLENLIGAKPTELIWTIDFYRLLLIPEMTFHDYMPESCRMNGVPRYLFQPTRLSGHSRSTSDPWASSSNEKSSYRNYVIMAVGVKLHICTYENSFQFFINPPLPSVSPQQLCALAYLACPCESGTYFLVQYKSLKIRIEKMCWNTVNKKHQCHGGFERFWYFEADILPGFQGPFWI